MTTTIHNLILTEIADELGDQAQEYLTEDCRRGLIQRFRRDLDDQYRTLLSDEERENVVDILDAADFEMPLRDEVIPRRLRHKQLEDRNGGAGPFFPQL